eukprot:7484-Heterococcus_DN1.PRE.1
MKSCSQRTICLPSSHLDMRNAKKGACAASSLESGHLCFFIVVRYTSRRQVMTKSKNCPKAIKGTIKCNQKSSIKSATSIAQTLHVYSNVQQHEGQGLSGYTFATVVARCMTKHQCSWHCALADYISAPPELAERKWERASSYHGLVITAYLSLLC